MSVTEQAGTKERPNKSGISIYLDDDVIFLLDKKVAQLDRSRSWFINDSLRRDLGLPPKVFGGKG